MCKFCELKETDKTAEIMAETLCFKGIKTIEFTADKRILPYVAKEGQDIVAINTDIDVSLGLDLSEGIKNRNFYCSVYKNIYNDMRELIVDEAEFIYLDFNYCPMCGRFLKGEKEDYGTEKDC